MKMCYEIEANISSHAVVTAKAIQRKLSEDINEKIAYEIEERKYAMPYIVIRFKTYLPNWFKIAFYLNGEIEISKNPKKLLQGRFKISDTPYKTAQKIYEAWKKHKVVEEYKKNLKTMIEQEKQQKTAQEIDEELKKLNMLLFNLQERKKLLKNKVTKLEGEIEICDDLIRDIKHLRLHIEQNINSFYREIDKIIEYINNVKYKIRRLKCLRD